MITLLDYVGLNLLRPLVAFGGESEGGSGGDSRPDEAKALDETGPNYGPPSVSSPALTYDQVEALSGGDDDRDSTPVPAVDPEQTTLEGLAQEQYLSYDPTTVDDFMVDMDPFDVETVQQLADQYYDFGSDPLSVADQVAQYDDVFSPSLTDDDMGLPDISVDEAMFTRGDIGQSDVVGGTSITPEISTPVPDVDLSDIYGQYRKSPNEPEARFIRDMMRFAKDDEGDYVVKPRLGDYLERAGLFVADLMLPEELLGLDISSATPDRVNAALEAYKTGSLAYGPDGKTLIGVNDSAGNLIRLRPDGPVDLFLDDDDDDCPPGYERNPVTGVCEPIEEEGSDPKITLPDVNRPDPSPVRPDLPIPGPIEPGPGPILPPPSRRGMKIRAPRFAEGGPVTPNIDRFLGSLRG